MRRLNSVGGHRAQPSSPDQADNANNNRNVVAQFNEGMDRLNSERNLSTEQQVRVDNLPQNSPLVRNYNRLTGITTVFWYSVLEHQQTLRGGVTARPRQTNEIASMMVDLANQWESLKNDLNQQE